MLRQFASASKLARSGSCRTSARSTKSSIRFNSTSSSSSSGEHPKKSTDLPWIIGSTLVFAPTIFYLTSPSSNSTDHHDVHHHDKLKKPNLPSIPIPAQIETPVESVEEDTSEIEVVEAEKVSAPQGAGDDHLKELAKGNEERHDKQKHSAEPAQLKPNPHKMEVAREHAVNAGKEGTNANTKDVVAEANSRREESKASSKSNEPVKEEAGSEKEEK